MSSYGNVGILQKLLLHFVEDECGIEETVQNQFYLANPENYRLAAEYYANQLNGLYQQLAKTLSRGIRKRPIYWYLCYYITDYCRCR